MAFICPNCKRNFGTQKEEFEKHINHCSIIINDDAEKQTNPKAKTGKKKSKMTKTW